MEKKKYALKMYISYVDLKSKNIFSFFPSFIKNKFHCEDAV